MKLIKKIAVISTLVIAAIVGLFYLVDHLVEAQRQWCLSNPKECSQRAAEQRAYLERESKKELNCGTTMPGYDQGWGGWRCKYEDD